MIASRREVERYPSGVWLKVLLRYQTRRGALSVCARLGWAGACAVCACDVVRRTMNHAVPHVSRTTDLRRAPPSCCTLSSISSTGDLSLRPAQSLFGSMFAADEHVFLNVLVRAPPLPRPRPSSLHTVAAPCAPSPHYVTFSVLAQRQGGF